MECPSDEKEGDVWKAAQKLSSFTVDEENAHKLRCASLKVRPSWKDVRNRTVIDKDFGQVLERERYVWSNVPKCCGINARRARGAPPRFFIFVCMASNKHRMERWTKFVLQVSTGCCQVELLGP